MRVALVLAAALLVGACNLVESLKEMQAQAEVAATLIEKDLGIRPLMGWNVQDGRFTTLTLRLMAQR